MEWLASAARVKRGGWRRDGGTWMSNDLLGGDSRLRASKAAIGPKRARSRPDRVLIEIYVSAGDLSRTEDISMQTVVRIPDSSPHDSLALLANQYEVSRLCAYARPAFRGFESDDQSER